MKDMPIDFVITWVDGNDLNWRQKKEKYLSEYSQHNMGKWNVSDARYRDWGLLKYWFRGVEKFAPWVNNIFFVTDHQIPEWLNTSHPKLKIVNHTDYIPEEYLPTFNSHCIELNFHRIEELSEQFVYFNDDMFLVADVKPEDFFKKNLPCDSAILNPIHMKQNGIRAEINDVYVINDFFDKKTVIKKNWKKWFNVRYKQHLLRTMLMLPFHYFTGFAINHVPLSYLKSTYKDVWSNAGDILDTTCRHKFRDTTDVNQWLFEYWQFAAGKFEPRAYDIGKMYEGAANYKQMCNDISEQKYKMICCNDAVDIADFDDTVHMVKKTFEALLPETSLFERV